jgi:hypothetical protein
MAKSIEHIHWPDAPDMWMPYAPAITVQGGTTVFRAGVTAAPAYHDHPHPPEEFDQDNRGHPFFDSKRYVDRRKQPFYVRGNRAKEKQWVHDCGEVRRT